MRAPRIALALSFVGAAAVVTWAACSVYDTSLLLPGKADASTDAPATIDGAPIPDAGADARGCPTLIPGPPAKDDPGDSKDYVIALRGLRVDLAPDAGTPDPPRGINHDRTCTCPEPESCTPPTNPNKERCDGPEGRDNAAAVVFTNFAAVAPKAFDPTFVRDQITAGLYTVLIRIQGYNGAKNDTKVAVSIYASNGIEGIQKLDGGLPPGPNFDGKDRWTVDPASTLSSAINNDCETGLDCIPNLDNVDAAGYVVDGTLVAKLSVKFTVSGLLSSYTVNLKSAYLIGKLTPSGAGFAFAGEYAGRWGLTDVLSSLAFVQIPGPDGGGAFLCRNNLAYPSVKSILCSGRDIALDPMQDNRGAACDAISTTISIEGIPARMGTVQKAPTKPNPCPQDADAGLDTCPP